MKLGVDKIDDRKTREMRMRRYDARMNKHGHYSYLNLSGGVESRHALKYRDAEAEPGSPLEAVSGSSASPAQNNLPVPVLAESESLTRSTDRQCGVSDEARGARELTDHDDGTSHLRGGQKLRKERTPEQLEAMRARMRHAQAARKKKK